MTMRGRPARIELTPMRMHSCSYRGCILKALPFSRSILNMLHLELCWLTLIDRAHE